MIFIMLQFEFLTLNVDAIIKWQHLHKTASPIKQWSSHLYMEILSIFSYSTFQQLFNDPVWFSVEILQTIQYNRTYVWRLPCWKQLIDPLIVCFIM